MMVEGRRWWLRVFIFSMKVLGCDIFARAAMMVDWRWACYWMGSGGWEMWWGTEVAASQGCLIPSCVLDASIYLYMHSLWTYEVNVVLTSCTLFSMDAMVALQEDAQLVIFSCVGSIKDLFRLSMPGNSTEEENGLIFILVNLWWT